MRGPQLQDVSELLDIENRYAGPIPFEERWAFRFGGRAAYERARIAALRRHIGRECARLVRSLTPSPALHIEIRRRLARRAALAVR